MNDDEFQCTCCGNIFDIEDSIEVDDELFCPNCAEGI